MRGSHSVSASRTWKATSPSVAVLIGAKTYWWIPQPKRGSVRRSPGAVPRTIQIASAMSCS